LIQLLIQLFLKARFGLVKFGQREPLITDGSIDSYYIDERAKKIYIIQSKFRAKASNFVSANVAADDLLKMEVKRVTEGHDCSATGARYNERIRNGLQKDIKKLRDVASYTISRHIGGMAHLRANLVENPGTKEVFQWTHGHEGLVDLVATPSRPPTASPAPASTA
jgi:hypothetical protein